MVDINDCECAKIKEAVSKETASAFLTGCVLVQVDSDTKPSEILSGLNGAITIKLQDQ